MLVGAMLAAGHARDREVLDLHIPHPIRELGLESFDF